MRKLIEVTDLGEYLQCDNPNCDFRVKVKITSSLVNILCPRCGENLLTFEDYQRAQKVKATVNFLNRWFSWLTIFYSKKAKEHKFIVTTHEKITLIRKEDDN